MDLRNEASLTNEYLDARETEAAKTTDDVMAIAARAAASSNASTIQDMEREIEAKVAKYRNSLYAEYAKAYPDLMNESKRAERDALMDFVKSLPQGRDNRIQIHL